MSYDGLDPGRTQEEIDARQTVECPDCWGEGGRPFPETGDCRNCKGKGKVPA